MGAAWVVNGHSAPSRDDNLTPDEVLDVLDSPARRPPHGNGYTPAVVGWAWAKRGRILDLPACYLDEIARHLPSTRLPDAFKRAVAQIEGGQR